ncbi:MAG: hypothetical protein HY847_14965 [Betaproteobacteria bacterium]|nr:hypothetical protein [Betaproteobacteria bacterium]
MTIQENHPTEANMEVDSLDGELVFGPAISAPKAEQAQQTQLPAPRGYSWQATMDLEPGMIIARPVTGTTGSRVTMHLAIGSSITADTIAQLINKGVECVAVMDGTSLPPEIHASTVTRYETRLREIFAPVPDSSCRPLFDALIKYGPL